MNRILSIVKKDITQIFRNRFMATITFLAIVAYALVYNFLPAKVAEEFKLGLYLRTAPEVARQFNLALGRKEIEKRLTEAEDTEERPQEALTIKWADSEKELKKTVEDNKVNAGCSIDLSGRKPSVVLYVSSETPLEVTEAGEVIAREIGYSLLGHRLPADFQATVLGPDMVGKQIPLRNKMRILFLTFVFLLEIYALGNLLVEEVQRKTVQALLVTPVNLTEFISAKAITGISLAFSEGLLAALLLRAINRETALPLVIFLLLGAIVMVGVAFLIGAVSPDFVSMATLSLLPVLTLILPGFVLLFPGVTSPLIKAIPTYHIVQPLDGILNYHLPLSNYYAQILYLFLFSFFFFAAGFWVLRRRLV